MKFIALDLPVLDIIIPKGLGQDVLGARKNPPGDKANLTDPKEIQQIQSLYRDIEKKLPEGERLYYLGGSGVRKLHHISAVFCESTTTLLGATSESIEGKLLKEKLKKSSVKLRDFGHSVTSERKSFIYTPTDQDDRVVLRFPYSAPKSIYNDIGQICAEIEKNDVILLEGGRLDIMEHSIFEAILEKAHKLKKDIVFFPPTTPMCLAKKSIRDLMIKAANFSRIMTMNAEEAIFTFIDHKYSSKVKSKNNPLLLKAIKNIQETLNDHKFVAVTIGKTGVYGITKKYRVFATPQKVQTITSTLGAGDAFSGAIIARYYSEYNGKHLKEADISDILRYGSDLASLVIQQPGSLIDPKVIACMW